MEQKSGKYWPGILFMAIFTLLCARKLLPVLWNQNAWQVIPAKSNPIPLFGNTAQEGEESRPASKVPTEQVVDVTAWKPVEELESVQTPEEAPVTEEEKSPQQESVPVEPEVPKEEPWPETMLPGEQININRASVADLTRLPLVGEKRAKAIVAWRRKNGPFKEFEDLLGVQGIGATTLEQLKRYITL